MRHIMKKYAGNAYVFYNSIMRKGYCSYRIKKKKMLKQKVSCAMC